MFFKLRKKVVILRTAHLEVLWGTKKLLLYGITVKKPFWKLYFKESTRITKCFESGNFYINACNPCGSVGHHLLYTTAVRVKSCN